MAVIRLSGVVKESIVDGPGIRYVIFTQGCPHKCEGCHNPQTHDFDGGYDGDTEQLLSEIKENPLISGVTFSGGEPFCQPEPLTQIAREVHKMKKNIVCYSGYKFEELIKVSNTKPEILDLLKEVDILIDGKFILEQKSLMLKFRGSKNQRIIDVKKSLEDETIAIIE